MLKLSSRKNNLESNNSVISWIYINDLKKLQDDIEFKFAHKLSGAHVNYKNKIMNVAHEIKFSEITRTTTQCSSIESSKVKHWVIKQTQKKKKGNSIIAQKSALVGKIFSETVDYLLSLRVAIIQLTS